MLNPTLVQTLRALVTGVAWLASSMAVAQPDANGGDPFGSLQWPDLKKEYLRNAPVVFDARVQVRAPAFAEDPMNVPVSVAVDGLDGVEEIVVLVDRNPIRKVLAYFPVAALPSVSFRFKLEQASPVRALARTRDGVWHVGGTLVDSSGGGCTAAGATRKDGTWDRTLGQVSARVFDNATPVPGFALTGAARLRLRVMHPMDTGLVGGIPAFYVNRLSVRDAGGAELLRLDTFEPVSENPVFSFDFAGRQTGVLTVVGSDNNGNRISSRVEVMRSAWLVFALWLAGAAPALAQRVDATTFDLGLQARALAPGVYVVEGANADFAPANGCNIINTGFIVTGAGVLVINTGASKRHGEQLRALIARTTTEPVVRVLHLNLHPDYFLGNQAFADVPRAATASTAAGMAREAAAYTTNLYRLCGDWLAGTEPLLPDATVMPGPLRIGAREFELLELQGHTASDLVLIDKASGIVFVGGLVFAQRVPTTPHAQIDAWLASLDALAARGATQIVPSHGPVEPHANAGGDGIAQTRRYLKWLDASFTAAAQQGLDMNEVLALPVPAEFSGWAAFATERVRNVAHLYPRYEQQAMPRR